MSREHANVEIMVSRKSAWHSLGEITGELNSRAKINEAGITFTAEKHQLEFQGNAIESYGIFRVMPDGSKEFIANVGKDYEIHQPSLLFDMIDEIIATAGGESKYEVAGILGCGEKVWGLVDIAASIRVGDDLIKPYLAGITSMDGSCRTKFFETMIRIVCQNTFNQANKAAENFFAIDHRSRSQARLRDVRKGLAAVGKDLKTIEDRLNFLAGRSAGGIDTVRGLLDLIIEKPVSKDPEKSLLDSQRRQNTLSEIIDLYDNNDADAFPIQRGTVYNLLNAITEYTDHKRSTRAKDESQRDIKRSTAALFGSGNLLKDKAMVVLGEYASKAPMKPVQKIVTGYDRSILDEIADSQ